MRFFQKDLRATCRGPLLMLGFQLGFFLFGILIVVLVNTFLNDDWDYAPVGSLMALIGIFAGMLTRGSGAAVRFRLAISMGQTRRDYLLMDPLLTALMALVGVGAAWCLLQAELGLYSLLYPGYENGIDLAAAFRWKYILPMVLGVSLLDLFLGAVQIRFGAKGLAMIWFPLCFAPGVIAQAVDAAQSGGTSLLARIGQGVLALVAPGPAVWAALGAAVVLAVLAFSVSGYRKAEIRF